MNEIVVREARHDEARFVMEMTRLMVLDMERYGGCSAATAESAWDKVGVAIAEELKEDKYKYLIAETANGDRIGLAAAKIVTLGGAFAPKTNIHLSVVYVRPHFRRAGVGRELILRALKWGYDMGGEYCDLNVLAENPAISLYKKLGFAETAIKMKRPLQTV
jgi:ribosomal protein S18 acetylase RimI-like enzyme